MRFKDFIHMYDNWHGTLKVNNNCLQQIAKGNTYQILSTHQELYDKKVISFGFYDNELVVRIV